MKRSAILREASDQALLNYEDRKEEIQKLLKQIAAGLEEHDRNASLEGGHHWGHVGDLNRIESELSDIKNRLYGTGEYAGSRKVRRVFNREGKSVEVVIPS